MREGWLFLALFSSLAIPGRFLPLFYEAHSLSPSQIGVILASHRVVSIFTTPLLCNLADRTNRLLVTGILYFLASAFFLAHIIALPELALIPASKRFPLFLTLRPITGVLMSPCYSIVSAITIAQLKERYGQHGHHRFGGERLWGAVSWAVCGVSLGFLLDYFGMWVVYVGQPLFASGFIFTLALFSLQGPPSQKPDALESKDNQSPLRVLYLLFQGNALSTLLFLHMILWLYMGMSIVENLLFLFFRDDLHASNLLCGVSVVVTVVFEIPLFARAPTLLQRYGTRVLAMTACMAYSLRVVGYSLAPSGRVALMLEPLHGITFALSHTAAVSYVSERMPKELEASGQSLLKVMSGVAGVIGVGGGGWIMEKLGAKVMYRLAGGIVLLATLAFGVGG